MAAQPCPVAGVNRVRRWLPFTPKNRPKKRRDGKKAVK